MTGPSPDLSAVAPNPTPAVDINHIIAERRAKLAQWRQTGMAYPNDFRPSDTAADIQSEHAQYSREQLETDLISVAVAGRMTLRRVMGRASFATVHDGSGADSSGQIQFYITDERVGASVHQDFKHWDIGDIIGARGYLFRTKTGELSVHVIKLYLLSKCLRPLPEKYHGLSDQEIKYRQRYVDLITDQTSRLRFIRRSRILQSLRAKMVEQDFLEVETPMLHPIPGGASARPFITHHNALDLQMFLRVAPELYLKRLLVGGFPRVFEINRNFRNEGISTRHNPEFTMMEFYAVYTDYQWLMDFTENLIRSVAKLSLGETVNLSALPWHDKTIDLESAFERLSIRQALVRYHPQYPARTFDDVSLLRSALKEAGVDPLIYTNTTEISVLQLALFEHTVEPLLINPTYITDYPISASPLSRRSTKHPDIAERFELFIGGREIANGFSELNDPEDQAERFRRQAINHADGDLEAMHYDADYIRALEYAMPPAGGCGIGIDRLVMLLTNMPSIRDVLLFPLLRPE